MTKIAAAYQFRGFDARRFLEGKTLVFAGAAPWYGGHKDAQGNWVVEEDNRLGARVNVVVAKDETAYRVNKAGVCPSNLNAVLTIRVPGKMPEDYSGYQGLSEEDRAADLATYAQAVMACTVVEIVNPHDAAEYDGELSWILADDLRALGETAGAKAAKASKASE